MARLNSRGNKALQRATSTGRESNGVLRFAGTDAGAWAGALTNSDVNGISPELLRNYWQSGISPGDWIDIAIRTGKILRENQQHAAIVSFADIQHHPFAMMAQNSSGIRSTVLSQFHQLVQDHALVSLPAALVSARRLGYHGPPLFHR